MSGVFIVTQAVRGTVLYMGVWMIKGPVPTQHIINSPPLLSPKQGVTLVPSSMVTVLSFETPRSAPGVHHSIFKCHQDEN